MSSFLGDIKHNQKAFTIVELLVATVVFATMLLVCSLGLIQITRIYTKSIRSTKTQEVARAVIEDISNNIQFSTQAPSLPTTPPPTFLKFNSSSGPGTTTSFTPESGGPPQTRNAYYFCIGRTRYSFYSDLIFKKPGNHVLWRDQLPIDGCTFGAAELNAANPSAAAGATDGRELLSENMELAFLDVATITGGKVYKIEIVVATAVGDSDLTGSGAGAQCVIRKGSEFCAFSRLTTFVQRRL